LHNKRFFGLSTLVNVGLIKQVGKIRLGPMISIPIYDMWKQDAVFPEESNINVRSKWLRGIVAGISFNYLLIKKTN
jgi:hypothetical protein